MNGYSIITAVTPYTRYALNENEDDEEKLLIGVNNGLPWTKRKSDLKLFSKLTCDAPDGHINVVVMGRRTFESIPDTARPLKGRINVVLTSDANEKLTWDKDKKKKYNGVLTMSSIDKLVDWVENNKRRCPAAPDGQRIWSVWFIGGKRVYDNALNSGLVDKMVISWMSPLKKDLDYLSDVEMQSKLRLVDFPMNFREIEGVLSHWEKTNVFTMNVSEQFETREYTLANYNERALLAKMARISATGSVARVGSGGVRTDVGYSWSVGETIRYDLRGGVLPAMTTRRLFIRGIFEELMWFLRGETDSHTLEKRHVNVWTGNSTREFLDGRGLKHLREGDIGAGYGFQIRHFGAEYKGCDTDYKHPIWQGKDQLSALIKGIKEEPMSRRHIVSMWNPSALDETALPPCHDFYQWHVDPEKRTISCSFYQRSSDLFLAGNWNAVSAAIWTYLIGYMTDYEPSEVVMMIGNAHIYDNHKEQVAEQVSREPRIFPRIMLNPKEREIVEITDFEWRDIRILNYLPQKSITGKMN